MKRAYAGVVYDALHELGVPDTDCVISRKIKPLDPMVQTYGPVLPCYGRRCQGEDWKTLDRQRLDVYAHVTSGCVVVLQAEDDYCAHAGDIGLLVCQRQGAAGFVTDGNVRDARRIVQMRFPCFCAGVTPIDAVGYWSWIGASRCVQLGGVPIEQGDWLFGDGDGVLRVPGKLRPEVEKRVAANIQREDQIRRWVTEARGPSRIAKAANEAYAKFGRW